MAASKAELLQGVRKQRQEADATARHQAEAAAVLRIQGLARGYLARRRWSEAEWKSLQKQVHDLDQLAEIVRQKGQHFVAPFRVLLPLLVRARHPLQARRPAGERAELLGKLAGLAAAGLRAPATDAQRGLCGTFAAARALHAPDPMRVVLRFWEALFTAVISTTTAAGAFELAEILDVTSWGQGRALEETPACHQLASALLASALEATPWPAGGRGPSKRLKAWRTAATAAIAAWPGGAASVPPRLQGLLGVAMAWLRLMGLEPGAAPSSSSRAPPPPGPWPGAELLEAVLGVPRVGALMAPQASVGIPWARFLEAYAGTLRLCSPCADVGRTTAKALDREYILVYSAGNLWELQATCPLVPLEPVLAVQAQLAGYLEVSMLPGFPAPSVDEPLAAQGLREQLRQFADPAAIVRLFGKVLHLQSRPSRAHQGQGVPVLHEEVPLPPGVPAASTDEPLLASARRKQPRHFAAPAAVARLFGRVLHLQPRQTGPSELARPLKALRTPCVAVPLEEVSPAAVAALCQIYSLVLLRARAAAKASKAGWGTQVYYSLANTIAYMEGGDVAKVLWRFATRFCNLTPGPHLATMPLECYHVLHVHSTVLFQLLSVMSHDELRGSQCQGPLCEHDLAGYISRTTHLAAQLIWDSACATPAEDAGAGASTWPRGALVEALLEQSGKVLSQLHGFADRLPPSASTALPPDTWHAPQEVLGEFRQAMERASVSTGSSQRMAALRTCSERLLRTLPHSVPFEQRVALLRSWIQERREEARAVPPVRVVVRRTHIFEDGLVALGHADWRARFQVVFVNAAGMQEQGQDAGGLFKEFLEKLAETAFNPDYGLFRATESRLLYPNPEAAKYHEHAGKLLEFLGLVLGKAIYEGIVVEPCFAPFFLAKLLGRHNSYYDLQTLDPSLFSNLQRLKGYDGNVADLCCSFVVSGASGEEVPLLPDGQNVPVTNENRFRYLYLLSDYKLNVELRAGSSAFLSGFQRLLEERWLRMFGEGELQQVISGSSGGGLDVEDLRRHTQFSNCGPRDKVVQDFFRALSELSPQQQTGVLRFATSCSRTPLLGFSHLVPPFTLHKVHVRTDSEKLPTSSTCFNTLKLPAYSNWKVMKQKLEFVIEQGAGFELD